MRPVLTRLRQPGLIARLYVVALVTMSFVLVVVVFWVVPLNAAPTIKIALLAAPFLLGLSLGGGVILALARLQAELKGQTLDLAAQALDARDRWTESHSMRVAELARRLGKQLGLDARACNLIFTAGSLHDLGKIGIRDDILSKPGPLTEEEWQIMRRHPDIGADMIGQHSALQPVASLVRHHHERWDGSGYPAGLKGEQSPFGARIIAVAESYDYITNIAWTLHRRRLSADEAVRDIGEHSGSWYDPNVVDALREVHRIGTADSRPITKTGGALPGVGGIPVAAKSPGSADLGADRSVTVLVADDSEVARRLCSRVLEKAGYRVLTASDGLETVSLALASSPDVVLLDDAMPGMDSLEAIRQIKAQRPGMPIVLAGVELKARDRGERFLAAGADEVLSKPFRLIDLIAVVARLAGNRGRA